MPSLLEEINQRRRPAKLCRFGRWLSTASKKDRDDLEGVFADPTVSSVLISEVLSSRIEGHTVDYIRMHRRGGCPSCPKDLLNG